MKNKRLDRIEKRIYDLEETIKNVCQHEYDYEKSHWIGGGYQTYCSICGHRERVGDTEHYLALQEQRISKAKKTIEAYNYKVTLRKVKDGTA